MSNMSYCRFENTMADLTDCFEALEIGEIESDREKRTAVRMLIKMVYFLFKQDIIEDMPEDFQDRIRALVEIEPEEK